MGIQCSNDSSSPMRLTSDGGDQVCTGAPQSNGLLDTFLSQKTGAGKTRVSKTEASAVHVMRSNLSVTPDQTLPAVAKTNSLAKPAAQVNTEPVPPPGKSPTEWTVVVDLGILFDQVGSKGHLGAEEKLKALEQLKESTKGKPVTIVVEALQNDGKDVQGQELSRSKQPYSVERVVLRDGQETVVSNGPSKGLKDDFQDLLDFALTQQPGNKVAVAVNAHGLGDQGIAGGMQEEPGRQNGPLLSAEELAGVIKSSLTKVGRDKLDLLDFDSCLMGELGVLRQMDPVTKQLVASEENETAGVTTGPAVAESSVSSAKPPSVVIYNEVDGQNLTPWIADIVANPAINGFEVGQDIVQRANKGANGVGSNQGTETLVHFDLENHFSEFNNRLNALGKTLSEASQADRDQIRSSIDLVKDVVPEDRQHSADPSTMVKRDMEGFLNLLSFKIASGTITDPDHQIGQALSQMQAYLRDRTKLLSAAHIPPLNKFGDKVVLNYSNNEGGLSLFLPNKDIRENSRMPEANLEKLYEDEAGTTDCGWLDFLRSLRVPVKRNSLFPPP